MDFYRNWLFSKPVVSPPAGHLREYRFHIGRRFPDFSRIYLQFHPESVGLILSGVEGQVSHDGALNLLVMNLLWAGRSGCRRDYTGQLSVTEQWPLGRCRCVFVHFTATLLARTSCEPTMSELAAMCVQLRDSWTLRLLPGIGLVTFCQHETLFIHRIKKIQPAKRLSLGKPWNPQLWFPVDGSVWF